MGLIVVDTSAVVAMLQDEPERAAFAAIVARAHRRVVSTVSLLEAGMVAFGRRGATGLLALDQLVTDTELEIVPFDDTQRRLALAAFSRYGKGVNPVARLNFGDCAVYALAKGMNAPLLFKGDDFTAIDLLSARV
jgi:ribonuclease VapC